LSVFEGAAASMANSIPGPSANPAVVLHIEDDNSVALAVARVLRLEGYKVVIAASGVEAIQLVEKDLVPDLILTDYHLPLKMSGDQVITEIQTRLGFKPPTIMLASLSNMEVDKMASVADRVFAKPVDMTVMLQAIRRLLSARIDLK
jgi:CheY-like chemotaxis protein